MAFLIQTIENQVKHDFSLTLLEAIRYNYGFLKSNIDYVLSDRIPHNIELCKHLIPVGSVEFVIEFYKKTYSIDLKPINVPECLFKYAGRKIKNFNKRNYNNIPKRFENCNKLFIKSNDIVKHKMTLDWYRLTDINKINADNVQVSEIINIDAEYRCFVYNGRLIDIRRYSGDCDVLPCIDTIYMMISEYSNNISPISYTLDIGINLEANQTFVIEVHDIYSCGLYGFNDLNKYPRMLYDWHINLLNKK